LLKFRQLTDRIFHNTVNFALIINNLITGNLPKDWYEYYPNAGFEVIHHGNYLNYILKQGDKQ
jgi:hypothetical protein